MKSLLELLSERCNGRGGENGFAIHADDRSHFCFFVREETEWISGCLSLEETLDAIVLHQWRINMYEFLNASARSCIYSSPAFDKKNK